MNLIDVIAKFARMSARSTAFVEVRALSGLRQEIGWDGVPTTEPTGLRGSPIQAGVQRQDNHGGV